MRTSQLRPRNKPTGRHTRHAPSIAHQHCATHLVRRAFTSLLPVPLLGPVTRWSASRRQARATVRVVPDPRDLISMPLGHKRNSRPGCGSAPHPPTDATCGDHPDTQRQQPWLRVDLLSDVPRPSPAVAFAALDEARAGSCTAAQCQLALHSAGAPQPRLPPHPRDVALQAVALQAAAHWCLPPAERWDADACQHTLSTRPQTAHLPCTHATVTAERCVLFRSCAPAPVNVAWGALGRSRWSGGCRYTG